MSFRCKLSPQGMAFLEQIAAIGIHGKTAAEVGSKLLSNELERLVIREKILSFLPPASSPAPSQNTKAQPPRRAASRKKNTAKPL